jgi:hypothetical protein
MARQLVKYEFDDGTYMYVETEIGQTDSHLVRAGISDVAVKASQKFQEAFTPVSKTAEYIREQISKIANPPKEVSIDFGIKFSARGDVIVVGADVEANCKLHIKW